MEQIGLRVAFANLRDADAGLPFHDLLAGGVGQGIVEVVARLSIVQNRDGAHGLAGLVGILADKREIRIERFCQLGHHRVEELVAHGGNPLHNVADALFDQDALGDIVDADHSAFGIVFEEGIDGDVGVACAAIFADWNALFLLCSAFADSAFDLGHLLGQLWKDGLQRFPLGVGCRDVGGTLCLPVPLGHAAIDLHAHQNRGHRVDDVAELRPQLAKLFPGLFASRDVPRRAEGSNDLSIFIIARSLGREIPSVALGRGGKLLHLHGSFGTHHLEFILEFFLRLFLRQEVEVGFPDHLLGRQIDFDGLGVVDLDKAAVTILEVDQIRGVLHERAEQVALEVQLFLNGHAGGDVAANPSVAHDVPRLVVEGYRAGFKHNDPAGFVAVDVDH